MKLADWPHGAIALLLLFAGRPVTAGDGNPAFDTYAKPGRLIEIAPRRHINLRCGGTGKVTIILEAGLGFPSLSWRKVAPSLSRLTRTCAYDRAGLGFSDAGPMPRDTDAIVRDLEAVLAKAKIAPPYLLVGNSLGGQPARLFAFRHPERVAGMVLVDPYVEGQYDAFARIDPSIAADVIALDKEEKACVEALRSRMLTVAQAEQRDCIASPDPAFSTRLMAVLRAQRMSPASFETSYSETLMLDTTNARILELERRDLSPIPIIVLSANQNFEGTSSAATRAALLTEQRRLHAKLAALSSAGEVRRVEAKHVIQSSNPKAVIDAVSDILKKVK